MHTDALDEKAHAEFYLHNQITYQFTWIKFLI